MPNQNAVNEETYRSGAHCASREKNQTDLQRLEENEMLELTYHWAGDYLIPDLDPPGQSGDGSLIDFPIDPK